MGQSWESHVQAVVRQACQNGEVVDTAAVADAVLRQYPDADRRALMDGILAEVVRASGNAHIGN